MKRRNRQHWQRAERAAADKPVAQPGPTRDPFLSDKGKSWAIFPAELPIVKQLSKWSVKIALLRNPSAGWSLVAFYRRIAASIHAPVRSETEWTCDLPDFGTVTITTPEPKHVPFDAKSVAIAAQLDNEAAKRIAERVWQDTRRANELIRDSYAQAALA